MTRVLPRRLAAVGLVCLAASLVACGSSRTAGAGSLTVTAHAASQVAVPPPATVEVGRRDRRVSFTRVPLRGTGHTVIVPRGWRAQLWAHVNAARFEAWSPQGTLLVSSPDDGTVTELRPTGDRPGARPGAETVVSGLTLPQGLAFGRVSGREYLYVAASNALYRYGWTASGQAVDRQTIVANLPDTRPAGDDVHRDKDVVVARDQTIFLDIGSSSNATIPAAVPSGTLPRASVIAFHPDGRLDRVWATGVRNGDGLAIAPDGSLWAAVNERDQITYPFHHGYGGVANAYGQQITAYVNNHPPDEVARLTEGRNLGWPYCDPDPDVTPGASDTRFRYGDLPFIDDQQTNPGGRRLDCGRLQPLQVGLPAHSAPLGMSFLSGSRLPARWAAGAVVAGHGSWDRQPPRAPVLYWMPWEARTHTLGPAITLVSGFQNADGSRWGRLADAVPGPDGSLYVTDDQSGMVYRITP